MKYLLVLSMLLLAGCGPETFQEPQEPTPVLTSIGAEYQQSLLQAKKEKKPILIVFHADWCGPCQKLNNSTLNNSTVKTELKKFIYIRINIDDNKDLSRQYSVSGIPAYVVIDHNENVLTQGTGYRPVQDFLNWLKSAFQKVPVSGV